MNRAVAPPPKVLRGVHLYFDGGRGLTVRLAIRTVTSGLRRLRRMQTLRNARPLLARGSVRTPTEPLRAFIVVRGNGRISRPAPH